MTNHINLFLAARWLARRWAEETDRLHEVAYAALKVELADFELNLAAETGPIPHWVTGLNEHQAVVVGAQLLTKDGRRIGNAHIVSGYTEGQDDFFEILTDAGNEARFDADEIDELFHIGQFLVDVEEVTRRFSRLDT